MHTQTAPPHDARDQCAQHEARARHAARAREVMPAWGATRAQTDAVANSAWPLEALIAFRLEQRKARRSRRTASRLSAAGIDARRSRPLSHSRERRSAPARRRACASSASGDDPGPGEPPPPRRRERREAVVA